MKKFFAITLAIVMMMAMALPALAEGNAGTTTVYCDIGSTLKTSIYAYAWENGNSSNNNAAWPGVQMTLVEGTVYKIDISSGIDTVLFHDYAHQTAELTIPTDGKNLYSCSTGEWSTYGDAVSNTSYINKSSGDYSIVVAGKYVASSTAGEKVSVDIAWESMSFTYTAGSSSYDVTTHKTTTKDGSWSTNKPGITVTNHSNVAIDANMSFAATASGVVGTFYTKSGNDFTAITTAANQKLSLESAEGKKRNDGQADDKSPKGTLYFGVSGDAISEDKTLGTVTVKIAKNTWTQVGTKDALLTAMANGGNIKLTDNIDTSDSGWVDFVKNTVLDLNGKTLTGAFGADRATLEREIKNGTLNSTWAQYVNNNHTLKLSDCTVNGGDADLGTINLAEYNATLIMSGTVNLQYGIVCTEGQGNTVTCLAGTYNFDPTAYVDTTSYTVSDNTDGTWTVTVKA